MHRTVKKKPKKKAAKNTDKPLPYWRESPFVNVDYDVPPHFITFFKSSARGEIISVDKMNLKVEDLETLIHISRDEKLKGSAFQENALRAIGYLKPTSSELIQKLVPLFNAASEGEVGEEEEGEANYAFDNSWICDSLCQLMSTLGEPAVDAIIPFLADNEVNCEGKGYAVEVVKNVYSKSPQEMYTKTRDIFMKMISNYTWNTPLTNSLVAFTLAEMKVKESIPIVKKAFDEDKIDEEYDGNFSSYLSQMGEDMEVEDGDEEEAAMHAHQKNVDASNEIAYNDSMKSAKELIASKNYLAALNQLQVAWSTFMGLKNELPIADLIGECLINLQRYQEAIYVLSKPWAVQSALNFGTDISSIKNVLSKRAHAYEMMGIYDKASKDLQLLSAIDSSLKAKANILSKQSNVDKTKKTSISLPRRVVNLKIGPSLTSEVVEAKCCKKFDERKAMFVGPTSGYSATCHAAVFIRFPTLPKSKNNKTKIFSIPEDFVDQIFVIGDRIATSNSRNYTIKIWNMNSLSTPICVLPGHYALVRCIRIKEDTVVSCSDDRTIRVWDIKQKTCKLVIYGHHLFIHEIDFDSDSVFSATDGAIREYDINTGHWVRSYFIHQATRENRDFPSIWRVRINKEFILSSTAEHEVALYHRASETVLHRFNNYKDIYELCLNANTFGFSCRGKVIICETGTGQILDSISVSNESLGHFSIDEEKGLLYFGTWNEISVRKLEITTSAESVVTIPDVSINLRRCSHCNKLEQLEHEFKRCGRCKQVFYCSVTCQQADWNPKHKEECKPK